MLRRFFLSVLIIMALPAALVHASEVETDQLIISEYVHLPGNNGGDKALELYNGTNETIDLSEYQIVLYVNGANIGDSKNVKSETLWGTLEPRETFILINRNAQEDLMIEPFQTSTLPTFNGDDAVVLRHNGEIIDRFGQVGLGEVFSGGSTGPEVWSRKFEVTTGDPNAEASFDIYEEWTYQGEAHTLGKHGGGSVSSDDTGTLSITEAREVSDAFVTTEGVVTARHNNTLHIEDGAAGIAIFRQSQLSNVSIGDRITVSGTRADYGNLKQITDPTLIAINGTEEVVPTVIDASENFYDYESQLVTVEDVYLNDGSTAGADATNYPVEGYNLVVRDENTAFDLEVGKRYSSITGTLIVYNDTWQLLPRTSEDVAGDVNQAHTPKSNVFPSRVALGTTIELSSESADAEIYYTFNGSVPTTNDYHYTEPIVLDEPGSVTITAIAFSETLDASQVAQWTYDVNDGEYIFIHEVQGERHISPFDGAHVSDVYGIVTFYYQDRGNHYFHMQTPDELTDENPNTSEGIIVFSSSEHPLVEVGDEVMVSGEVQEFYIDGFDDRRRTDLPVTQINARETVGGEIVVMSRGNVLPAPMVIEDEDIPLEIASPEHFSDGLEDMYFDRDAYAIDFWESMEGMRVQINDAYAVSPQMHGDVITVINDEQINTDNGGVLLTEEGPMSNLVHFRMFDNRKARDFPVKTGDMFEGPLIGHVSYAYQHYKLNIDLEEMQEAFVDGDTVAEITSIEPHSDQLTIASYNLENFSASEEQTSNDKAEKLARAFVDDMKAPDIIGVTEVQDADGPVDSGDPSAAASYARLVETIAEYGGPEYEFVHIDPIDGADGGQPGANIQTGFLYNPERVTFNDTVPHGTALDAVSYQNGQLTLNPGRINPESEILNSTRKPLVAQFSFQGEDVLVIVNHWNSKLGDEPHWGQVQPADTGSEDKRIAISLLVQDFVREVMSENPDANIVSVGDFNAFQWEESLLIQEDEFFTNMIHKIPEYQRYSYIYNGSSQVLDHIFVSNHLVDSTTIDIVKINTDFTDMHGRASDHDPVMIQTDFSE